MDENTVRASLDRIRPLPGAEQRMYAHIQEKSRRSAAGRRIVRVLIPAAVCVLLLIPALLSPAKPEPKPPALVSVGSPVQAADGPDSAARLCGVYLEAPAGAEEAAYSVLSGSVVRVDFSLSGIPYVYLASASRQDDFTFLSGDTEPALSLPRGCLTRVDGKSWKLHIAEDGITGYILNYAGASQEDMEALAREFAPRIP